MNRFMAVVVAPFFGLIMLLTGAYQLYVQLRFDAGGETIQGTVVTIEYSKGSRPSTGPGSQKVTYQFTTVDGRTVQGFDKVSLETTRSLRVGGPVAVEYLADDPSTNQIHEVVEEGLYVVWMLIGAGLISIGALWLRHSARTSATARTALPNRDRADTTVASL